MRILRVPLPPIRTSGDWKSLLGNLTSVPSADPRGGPCVAGWPVFGAADGASSGSFWDEAAQRRLTRIARLALGVRSLTNLALSGPPIFGPPAPEFERDECTPDPCAPCNGGRIR